MSSSPWSSPARRLIRLINAPMVIVLFVAGFHTLAIAIALADVDGIPEADTGNRPCVGNSDVRTELLFRLRLQPCKNFLLVVVGKFLSAAAELINGNVLRVSPVTATVPPQMQPTPAASRFKYRATRRGAGQEVE
ncbi:MAG: hypothetical protein U0936_26725 [Planctomycetaceae bacterium]